MNLQDSVTKTPSVRFSATYLALETHLPFADLFEIIKTTFNIKSRKLKTE